MNNPELKRYKSEAYEHVCGKYIKGLITFEEREKFGRNIYAATTIAEATLIAVYGQPKLKA